MPPFRGAFLMMNLSYWERNGWLANVDFTIVGSGIVGLSCALELRKQYPKAKIIVIEKGMFPQGASTKNAGFACFGSLSEILEDLNHHTEEEVLQLIRQRLDGLKLLRETLGDKTIDYKPFGGYELFMKKDQEVFEQCMTQMSYVNRLLKPVVQNDVFLEKNDSFQFGSIIPKLSFNALEGQIDTGKMMKALLKKAVEEDVLVINNCQLIKFTEELNNVHLLTHQFEFKTQYLMIATNGFARQLLDCEVSPARAQVLITNPIPNLRIKGSFHLDRGYYYFRDIDNRILFGGGRNLDFQGEETTKFGETEIIQNRLEHLLKQVILPSEDFFIEQRWSGIMGVGTQKKPIVKPVGNRVFCGVRLGGMGVAIGSTVGRNLACLVS
jgi:gamma-glutamylputrescine oxidase